jgi:diguanylate cyclase (GGDEF)-like protein
VPAHDLLAPAATATDRDALTGLPNRRGLAIRLEHAMAVARRERCAAAVLFIDFDGFKAVNDTRGHAAGDAVLREMARRLKARTRDTDTVARWGGDEFVVVVERLDDTRDVAALAGKLLAVVAEPIAFDGDVLEMSTSIGISLFPGDGGTADELVAAADAAMYAAKGGGRAAFRYYSSRMHEDAQARAATGDALRRGLAEGAFDIHFEPQWDVAAGRLAGCEATPVWRRADGAQVPAAAFMADADRCGVSQPLARWLLAEVTAHAARLRNAGVSLPLSVGLTARQLADRGLAAALEQMLQKRALTAGAVQIVVDEQTAAQAARDVMATLRDLVRLGVPLALGNFGAGCSSLGALTTLPFRTVFMARDVVARSAEETGEVSMSGAVLAVGRHLGLRVVASGVDSTESALRLAAQGCHHMQGAHLADPVPQSNLMAYLRWARSPMGGRDGTAPNRPASARPPGYGRQPSQSSGPAMLDTADGGGGGRAIGAR